MYGIGICDVSKAVCDAIKGMILEYSEKSNVTVKINIYYSGEELCADLKKGRYLDILFLGVELCRMNGIEVGNYIRNQQGNRSTQLVYIADDESYALQLFKVQPIDFLMKPLEAAQVYEALELARKIVEENYGCFEYWQGHECFRVPFCDIIYFFSEGRKVKICTVRGIKEYYGSIRDIMIKLPEKFYSIHKSYIVNEDYIVRYAYEQMELLNGAILTISKPNRKKIRQKMLQRKCNRRC